MCNLEECTLTKRVDKPSRSLAKQWSAMSLPNFADVGAKEDWIAVGCGASENFREYQKEERYKIPREKMKRNR